MTSHPVIGISSESLPLTSTAAAADRSQPPLSLSRKVSLNTNITNISQWQ